VEVPEDIDSKMKYFIVPLSVSFPDGTRNETGYGAYLRNQNLETFLAVAANHGFEVIEKEQQDLVFYARLILRKG